MIVLQAHRGASHVAPENTMLAFARAVDEGADAIELDVRVTADDVAVIFHDDDLERMTGAKGRLATSTWAALHALSVRGEPIPRFDALVDFAGVHGLALNIELKATARPQALVAACAPTLSQLAAKVSVLVSSFDPRALAMLHAILPSLPLALIFEDPRALAALPLLPAVDLHPRHDLIDATSAAAWLASAPERKLRAWTVDRADDARRLMALCHPTEPDVPAVAALITNRPGPLRAELAELAELASLSEGPIAS